MWRPKTVATKSVMSTFVGILMLTSLAGNGSVLAVFTRFKRLRTFPNILLGNLALVDFLSVLINMPIFLNNVVLESGQVEGKSSFSLVAASLQFGFVILNLASMIAIMLDRFLALSLDFRYHVWKTKKRAVVSAALLWLACSFLAVSTILPALDIESADYSIEEYRWLVFQKRKPYVCSIFGLFIVGAVILGIMTAFVIRQRKKKRVKLKLSALQAKAKLKMDIKATKNVALSVAVFIVCHFPTIAFTIFGQENHHSGNVWFIFFAAFGPYISKATNPFIFALRGRRFFLALKQFFKDPCGKSPFQERAPDVLRDKEKNKKTPRKEGKDIEKQAKDRRKPRGKRAAVDCMPQESQQKHRQVKQAWCRVTKKVPRDRSFDF